MDFQVGIFDPSLEIGVQVSGKDVTNVRHPRSYQYKITRRISHQDERRKDILARQKKQRFDFLSYIRNIIGISEDGDEFLQESEMEWLASGNCKKLSKKTYKNQLMLSEWLEDVPEDLERQWLLVLCPEGKRSLIIAAKGSTKCYSKGGYCINSFSSFLPGGNRNLSDPMKKDYTVLDCIFNENENTYYVLDIMCWRGHPVYESETEFRFYWVKTKLEETPDVQIYSSQNPHRFLPVPHYQCTREELTEALWSPMPFSPKLDGLLFYHKLTHYTPGSTPLVGWLKAYMVPELLHVNVPDSLMAEKPAKYTCFKEHVKVALKKKRQKEQPMDVISADENG